MLQSNFICEVIALQGLLSTSLKITLGVLGERTTPFNLLKELLNKTMPFLDNLTDILSALEIKTLYIRPLQVNKQKTYVLSPYQIEIECPYEKFGKLLSKLEKNDRLIVVDEFRFFSNAQKLSKLKDPESVMNHKVYLVISAVTLNKARG